MRISSIALSTVLALALGGCASMHGLHPSAAPLRADTLQSAHSLDAAAAADHAWPADDWWKTLGDPQLDRLIAEALKHNPDLAAADARAQAASAEAASVDADLKPTVSAGASIAGARLPTTAIPAPMGGHFALAKYAYGRFAWNLDLWGGDRAAWEAAVSRARAADIDARAARLELSTDVVRAYARLGYAFNRQDIAQQELARARKVEGLTRQRQQAGIDSDFQLQQAHAAVASAREQLEAAGNGVSAARIALAVLLGEGPDRGLQIQRPKVLTPATLAVPNKLPTALLGRRPDLVAARLRVEAAGHDIKTAKARFMPNVSISALAGVLAVGGGTNLFQLPARFYNVAPAVSVPIFEGGRLRANLKARDAAYDIAVATYNSTLIGALNGIADDLSALRSLRRQSRAQAQALASARKAWNMAEQRYQAGVGSYLQALSVRQQLLAAQQRAAALHEQQVDVSVQLVHALGGGFHSDAADTAAAHSPSTPATHS